MFSAFVVGLFQKKPDVVVATSPQFFTAVGGWALAATRRLPFVFELGDLWPATITAVGAMRESVVLRWLERLELFLYRRSAAVVALTKAFKKDLVRRNIPEGKIAVVRNGVDLTRYEPRTRDKTLENQYGLKDVFTIGYIGTHGMAHALENVLDAAEYIRDRNDIRFLFVGPGAERDHLIAEAKRRRLENVLFIPPQPKSRMPDYWSLCHVALVHLKNDPVFETVIPSKIFEAMGMGLPILLVSPRGEASDIIEAEQAGIYVPAGDPKALADAAVSFREDVPLYRTCAKKSLESAKNYSRERQSKEMLAVLEHVVAKGGDMVAEVVVP